MLHVQHTRLLPNITNCQMTNSLNIFSLSFILIVSALTFGQVPKEGPQIYSYQDIQNSKYVGENFSKIWIVKGALSNNNWNESVEYYEFDKEGRVIIKVSDKFKNGTLIKDTTIFTYGENELWETKYELGEMNIRNFEYDNNNRLIKISSSNGDLTKYSYFDNNLVSKITYSLDSWKSYEYLKNGLLKSTKTFRDSVLYQIDEYNYHSSKIQYTRSNIYAFAPKDTVVEYTDFHYNKDTLLTKIVFKSEDSSGWVTSITSMRYQNNLLTTITDCLTNDSNCGYTDRIYTENKNLWRATAYSDNGLKTREVTFKYESW